jgi:antitoxin component of MazEF toxin-antitoxin module
MIKKLTHHGNSMALIIESPILKLLNITEKTPLEIATDGTNIVISPVHDSKREKSFRAALAKVNQRHGKTLKALAK